MTASVIREGSPVAMVDSGERAYLTRKEAAQYLSRHYFEISPTTLARYAVTGEGPEFRYASRPIGKALYTRTDLDAWARGLPVGSKNGGNGAG